MVATAVVVMVVVVAVAGLLLGALASSSTSSTISAFATAAPCDVRKGCVAVIAVALDNGAPFSIPSEVPVQPPPDARNARDAWRLTPAASPFPPSRRSVGGADPSAEAEAEAETTVPVGVTGTGT